MSQKRRAKQTEHNFLEKIRSIQWFESLQFRLSMGLLIIVSILILAVFSVNQTLLRTVLIENKFDLVEQAGNSLVTELGQQIEATEALTRSISSVGRDLPKDESLFKVVIPHMMENDAISPFVAGGGIWPEPFAFEKDKYRRSFFWARKESNDLLYYDDYNDPKGNGYHQEEWYVPAKYIGRDRCFWSKSYMDPYSFEPMVTCSVPMHRRDQLHGVATIDLKLSGLQKFFAERAEKLGGYAFAVDRNNKFLSYPELKLVQSEKDGGRPGELITVKNFTDRNPEFEPLAKALSNLSSGIIKTAEAKEALDANLVKTISKESYQISEDEARMIVATFSDPFKANEDISAMSSRFSLEDDILLKEPVLVSMFIMPKVFWKIVVVTPQSVAYADANAVTKNIIYLLIAILMVSVVGAYFWLRRILVQPLITITNEIKGGPLKRISLPKDDSSIVTEIDVLADTINSMRGQIAKSFDELQQSENRFRLIAETLPEGLAITRLSDGTILYLNSRLKQMLAIPDDQDALDAKLIDFFEDPKDRVKLFKKLRKTNEVNDFVVRALRLDGTRFWATISTSAVQYGGQSALVSGVLDITTRKETEEEVERYRSHLEQMVQERTAELEETKTLALNAAAAKQNFLANMSHEIRTPLNSVVGISHLLLSKEFLPNQKRYLMNLNKSGKILLKIINDILDITKMDAGKMEADKVRFDVNDVLDDISIHIRPLMSDKIIATYMMRPSSREQQLIGDPLRLEQILLNLISNAIKFTHEGHVKVTCSLTPDKTNPTKTVLHIDICDTGIGMSEDQLQTVFNAFTQADNAITREYGGTGLGLTISKNLIDLMGGKLAVESTYGEGSCFSVTIPFENTTGYVHEGYHFPKADYIFVSDDKLEAEALTSIFETLELPLSCYASQDFLKLPALSPSGTSFYILDWDQDRSHREKVFSALEKLRQDSKHNIYISLISQSGSDSAEYLLDRGEIDAILSKPARLSRIKSLLGSFFDLPFKDSDLAYDELAKSQSRHALAGINILLVEDNEQNQFVADEILASAGATIQIAQNGRDALDQLLHAGGDHFDLILMDLHMPVMDGFEASEKIREEFGENCPPIIALSAEIFDEVIDNCKKSGMDDYMAKPFSPNDMIATILRWARISGKTPTSIPAKTSQISKVENQLDDMAASTNTDVLNSKAGLSNLDSKVDLYARILAQYRDKYEKLEQELSDLLSQPNLEEAKRFLHTFSGLSATIGARGCEKLARDLKSSLGKDDSSNLQAELIEELNAVKTAIDDYLRVS
ncbi:MAG: ATP-binding protein [Alphaproteobacteria bacterium]|nr:ATP-binding protein [Alphaproteobacteria bacterium]